MRARLAMLVLLAAACAEDRSERPIGPVRHDLTVWNSTQRPLEEVRVHDGTEYLDAANELLSLNLPSLNDDERTVVEILYGQRVTVIRRNVDGGPRIAFTTAEDLPIDSDGYVLQVFQESFRLHAPDFVDGPPSDGGDVDGGDAGDPGGDP